MIKKGMQVTLMNMTSFPMNKELIGKEVIILDIFNNKVKIQTNIGNFEIERNKFNFQYVEEEAKKRGRPKR